MQSQYTTEAASRQELHDLSASGKERPWAKHKGEADYLASIYEYLSTVDNSLTSEDWLHRAARVSHCALKPEFAVQSDGSYKLKSARFCRLRLCPVCQWRRSLKMAGQTRVIVAAANAQRVEAKGKPYAWLMLTLTQHNVDDWQLSNEVKLIQRGCTDMMRCKRVSAAVKGWLRCTEVTHNTDWGSTSFDSYHPHIHMLLCVEPHYFKDKRYITQAEWAELWRHYAKLDYTPIVHVQRVRAADPGLIAEVSKYAAKPADYLVDYDLDLAARAVESLDQQLYRLRFAAYGGLLKELHARLHLDDTEDGDLIHTDPDATQDSTAEAAEKIVRYTWCPGIRTYTRDREG